jgi:hypothetical protein
MKKPSKTAAEFEASIEIFSVSWRTSCIGIFPDLTLTLGDLRLSG